jgi:GNAT superfamily N-acetyltransferase
MTGDVTIRRAKQVDFAHVAEMQNPVWRQSWTGVLAAQSLDLLGPKPWGYTKPLSRLGWGMWIAESGGQIVGMTTFGPDTANPGQLFFDELYVAQEKQGHGIGGRLMDTGLSLNPSSDAILWCAEINIRARRFYEKRNFHVDGRTFKWEPLPGVSVPHVGYRLYRSARRG